MAPAARRRGEHQTVDHGAPDGTPSPGNCSSLADGDRGGRRGETNLAHHRSPVRYEKSRYGKLIDTGAGPNPPNASAWASPQAFIVAMKLPENDLVPGVTATTQVAV